VVVEVVSESWLGYAIRSTVAGAANPLLGVTGSAPAATDQPIPARRGVVRPHVQHDSWADCGLAAQATPSSLYRSSVDVQDMRGLVESARVAHLATVAADGQPHIVPVCFVLSGEIAYSAVDRKPKRGPRLRRMANIEATGHACILVDRYGEDWSELWWVRLDGRGRVVADPVEAARAISALVGKYQQYAGRTPAGPVLAVDIARWSSWSAV
jgi:PPOX class probable F420-dependent enzyme